MKKIHAALHEDIIDVARPLLFRWRFFIFEQVLIRAGLCKHRRDVDWRFIRQRLIIFFPDGLMGVPAKLFLDLGSGAYEQSIKLTRRVEEVLRGLHGQTTAGLCLPAWQLEFTRRRIDAQRHVGDGLYRTAQAFEIGMNNPPQLSEPEHDGEAAETL